MEKNIKNIVYLDLDGVVVNFAKRAIRLINENRFNIIKYKEYVEYIVIKQGHKLINVNDLHPDFETKDEKIIEFMFKLLSNDKDFWINLEWLRGGMSLFNFINKNFANFYILSSPVPGDTACIEGKKEWVLKNMGICEDKIIIERNKSIYSSKDSILIDDFLINTNKWENGGGIAIHHKNCKSTINKLKKYL